MSAFSDRLERIEQNEQQSTSAFQRRLARVKNRQGDGSDEFEYGLYTEEDGILSDPYLTPKKPEDRSFGDMAAGVGEAALTTLTGATGGALGMIGGTIEGIGESIAEGKFGTTEGANDAQRTAFERAGQFTYEPRGEAGQEYIETIAKATEALPVIPLLAAETGAIRSGIRGSQVAAPIIANKAKTRIKSLISKKSPNIQVFASDGSLTQDAMRAISQNNLEPQVSSLLTPEQAERYNLFRAYGVQPTRPDVTRNVSDQRELREAIKEQGADGGGVVDAVAAQERQIRKVIETQADRLDDNVGGQVMTRDVIGSRIFESIDDFTKKSDLAVDNAYRAAREQAGIEGRPVIAGNIAQTVISNKKSDLNLGGIVSRVENILEDQGVIIENENGKMVIANKRLSVGEAENIRKLLNQISGASKPGPEGGQQRSFIRVLKNALDEDVERAVGKDIFAEARAEKSIFEDVMSRDKRDKRDIGKRELLRNIIDNKIPEDKLVERLLSADKESFKQVKEFLLSENGGQKGRQSFNNFKSYILRDLLDGSLNKRTLRGGEPEFNPVKLGTAVGKLDQRGLYKQMFTAEERKLITDVIKIGTIRTPDQAVSSGRGPSSFALTALVRSPLITKFPLLGEYIKDVGEAYSARRRDARLLDPMGGVEESVIRAAGRQAARQPAQQTMAP